MSKCIQGLSLGVLCLVLVSTISGALSHEGSVALSHEGVGRKQNVTYDGRSLIIDGRRELFFSGSIHYPRSTPDMWPDLIAKAKEGGINVISTYVFWNAHEPVEGKFNFKGRYNLVKFIKLIQKQGLYVILRIGPFIEAEWNHGGFPYWLREKPGIIFRTDNQPFKYYMKRYAKMIVNMMNKNELFAPQGGPIILTQIENEYNNVQQVFKERGADYVQWAGNMALKLNTGVPWIMCKQKDAPGAVINTCNGRNCGDTFTGPNSPNKPSLWTENWTAQYRVLGDPPSQRPAEDLAFAVARWFSKHGTLVNYYMYHGGTNFGRTTSSFVTTRYYDEAPLDEYGLVREPKWGHLRDLHRALKLSRKALLWGTHSNYSLGHQLEARVYQNSEKNVCSAFLANNNTREAATIYFQNVPYYLPPRSISILPDCKTVVFNTKKVNAQHNARTFHHVKDFSKGMRWKMFKDSIPNTEDTPVQNSLLLEHYNATKDTTDFLWYTTNIDVGSNDLPLLNSIKPILQVASWGHAVHGFVNDLYVGSSHGDHVQSPFSLNKPITLKPGKNKISLLSMTTGFPNSGGYMEHKIAGVSKVLIQGLMTGTQDLINNIWGHQVGLLGEKLEVYNPRSSKKVKWVDAKGHDHEPLIWYKRHFDAPAGSDPVALDMSSMGKGEIWVNGQSIGRYWVSYLTPLGLPSQSVYHIPRSFLKPKRNLLVILEETGGNPRRITLENVRRDIICGFVSENHPPKVKDFERSDSQIKALVHESELQPMLNLHCPSDNVIQTIDFASFGNPIGICSAFATGTCHSAVAKDIVEKACLGKESCVVSALPSNFGTDLCPGTIKTLAVQARCGPKRKIKH
ncbi:beta-galactosidase 11 isoform X1 [Amborella trichopoda]|uniref:Beta-galactosidase n=1 Tax=Amborella trichopoda TaxID=13333 RepID=W1NF92_AMBTC|nr:beta-galactosidase 11 isoform X1 [Amborella trichopoda]ERM93830.1 hypothetical protein AMTR_s00138p00054750 [Amborella trichopoda]|eukprot:XP_011629421.2 beta-galactosidase 11 isoform X1 [Amborella trichopoda]